MQNKSLAGKVAIVTGAGRGIGRVVAINLAEAGASVVLVARSESEIQSVLAEIKVGGGNGVCFPMDVSCEIDVHNLVKGIINLYQRIDIVINNAGTDAIASPLEFTRSEDWDRLMAVNAKGPFLLCRESIPFLRSNPRSFIVNIGSVMSVKGYVNQSAYAASKHALLGMTKVLAKEVYREGIRVHAICPGGVNTDLVRASNPNIDPSELISPQEIADIVMFLVNSEGAAAIDEIHVRRDPATPWA